MSATRRTGTDRARAGRLAAIGLLVLLSALGLSARAEAQEVPPVAAGSLQVRDFTTGGAVEQLFTFTAECVFGGGDVSATTLPATTFTLARQDVKEFNNLPAGSRCTVTEGDLGGDWNISSRANLDSPAPGRTAAGYVQPGTVLYLDFYNVHPEGVLEMSKTVKGATGNPVFRISYTCAKGDLTIAGDFDLANGGVFDRPAIPAGASCEVTETDPGPEWTTTVAVDAGPATAGRTASASITDQVTTVVAFTNTRSTGSTAGPAVTPTSTSAGSAPTTSSSPAPQGATQVEASTQSRSLPANRLPRTGDDSLPLVAFAAVLLNGGAIALATRRRLPVQLR